MSDPSLQPRSHRLRRRLWVGIRLGCSVGLLAWILRGRDLSHALEIIDAADLSLVAAGIGCVGMAHVALCLAAQELSKISRIRVSFGRMVRNHFGGLFWSLFLPSAIGGDVGRILDLRSIRRDVPVADVVAPFVLLRFLALFCTLILVALFLPQTELLPRDGAWWVAGTAAASAVFGSALVLSIVGRPWGGGWSAIRPWKEWGARLIHTPCGRGAAARATVLSMLSQLLLIAGTFELATALGLPMRFADAGGLVPLSSLAVLIPISLNGVGVREFVYVECLARIGVSALQAISLTAVLFLVNFAFAGVGGLLTLMGAGAASGAGARGADDQQHRRDTAVPRPDPVEGCHAIHS